MDNLPLISLSNDVYVLLLQRLNHDGPVLRYRSCTDPFDDSTRSLEPRAQFQKSLRKRGVVYSATSQHIGNSFIFFHRCESSIAGQIQEIFVHTQATNEQPMTEFFCIVKPLQELDQVDIPRDPYHPYHLLNVRLCYDEFDPVVVIKLHDIIGHCATCPYIDPQLSRKARVVLSLDRVSLPLHHHHNT